MHMGIALLGGGCEGARGRGRVRVACGRSASAGRWCEVLELGSGAWSLERMLGLWGRDHHEGLGLTR